MTKLKDLEGKTITKVRQYSSNLTLGFSDGTVYDIQFWSEWDKEDDPYGSFADEGIEITELDPKTTGVFLKRG